MSQWKLIVVITILCSVWQMWSKHRHKDKYTQSEHEVILQHSVHLPATLVS